MIKHINLSAEYDKKELERLHLAMKLDNIVRTANHRIRKLNNDVQYLQTRNTGTNLDQSLVKELIAFCHPDKHQGSEKANRLTQKLLDIRK